MCAWVSRWRKVLWRWKKKFEGFWFAETKEENPVTSTRLHSSRKGAISSQQLEFLELHHSRFSRLYNVFWRFWPITYLLFRRQHFFESQTVLWQRSSLLVWWHNKRAMCLLWFKKTVFVGTRTSRRAERSHWSVPCLRQNRWLRAIPSCHRSVLPPIERELWEFSLWRACTTVWLSRTSRINYFQNSKIPFCPSLKCRC